MLRQVVVNVVRHYLPEVDATVGTDRCLFLRWTGVCSGGIEIEVRFLFPEVDGSVGAKRFLDGFT